MLQQTGCRGDIGDLVGRDRALRLVMGDTARTLDNPQYIPSMGFHLGGSLGNALVAFDFGRPGRLLGGVVAISGVIPRHLGVPAGARAAGCCPAATPRRGGAVIVPKGRQTPEVWLESL